MTPIRYFAAAILAIVALLISAILTWQALRIGGSGLR